MNKTIGTALIFLTACPSFAGGLVAVDQAGYRKDAVKVAVLNVAADSFQVLDVANRQIMLRGSVTQSTNSDAATGMALWKADFSALQRSGEYCIIVSSGDTSQHFVVDDSVYSPVYRASLKGFYYQRCGTALVPLHAGQWWHPACHTADAAFHTTTGQAGTRDETGGWHDAGDYGKYVVNAGISVGTLLMAYEWFPSQFSADNLVIPESGNHIPDILDEVRYELNWLLKMQRDDGGVYFKVTRMQFEGFVMPNQDTGTRYIYQVSSTATGDFAAMMARAARVYRPFDSTFAAACLHAAVTAWGYLQAHPTIIPSGGFRNPGDTGTGEYGDGNDSDERLWAAAELYLANGDQTAHTYFIMSYSSGGIVTGTMGWPNVKTLAQLAYLRGNAPDIDAAVQATIKQSLLSYCQTLLTLHNQSGFGTALGLYDYYWGSNSQALNNAILMIMASEAGGTAAFAQAALDQLHYVLGVNAHGQSFVTGTGARHTMHPHHRPSAADGIVEPVPGLISGGPNRNITNDPVLQSNFTTSTPPALCYVDDQGSYASNEICINWNAPLVFVAGYFAREHSTASVEPSEPPLPRAVRLRQNYPNPFNGMTVIEFSLDHERTVDLMVVDLLGRLVASRHLGNLSRGDHRVQWAANGEGGVMISSGVYFYYLSTAGRQVSNVQKLVLAR